MMTVGIFKGYIGLVCLFSFIFSAGVSSVWAEPSGRTFPIGEMISRGEVLVQTQGNVWQKADHSSLPIFPGMIVKTEKGTAAISFADRDQVEVGPNSLLTMERQDQMRLSKGSVEFRIASPKGLTLFAGNLILMGSWGQQAGNHPVSLSGSEEAFGSLTVHPHGAVTIRGHSGYLTLLNRNRTVLASISPKNSITIPAPVAGSGRGGNGPVQTAQVGDEEEELPAAKEIKEPPDTAKSEKWEGLSGTTWVGIGLGALAIGGLAAAAGGGGGGGDSPPPACP